MKMVKDKKVLVGADFAGVPLKNAVVAHLEKNGWEVTDIGVKSVDEENPEMFHRIGLKVGAKIAEGEFEKALPSMSRTSRLQLTVRRGLRPVRGRRPVPRRRGPR